MTVGKAIETWAGENRFEVRQSDDGTRTQVGVHIDVDGTNVRMFVEGEEPSGLFEVFAYLDLPIPVEKARAVRDLLTLINAEVRMGSLELHESGNVRFKTGADLEDTTPGPKLVNSHVQAAVDVFRAYLGALLSVRWTEQTPSAAFRANAAKRDASSGSEPAKEATPESSAWLETLSSGAPTATWASFPGTSHVRAWAAALAETSAQQGSPDDAELRPRGVLFVGTSRDTCEDVARLSAAEAHYQFAFIPEDDVLELPLAHLASFEQLAPVMVLLQAGRWLAPPEAPSANADDREKVRAFQRALLERLRAFNAERPVIFCSTTGSPTGLEDKLVEVGAFDQTFAVPEPTPAAAGAAFIDLVGRNRCGDSLVGHPGKLGKTVTLALGSKAQRQLMALYLRRLGARCQRKVEFIDLVEAYTRGFVHNSEEGGNPASVKRSIAIHEAGHAAMTVLDSGGADVPDFCSIIPTSNFQGVVVTSLSHLHDADEHSSYADFRHIVRCSLAGRAAEELLFGPENVGSGASADLQSATRGAYHAFTVCGFAPNMTSAEASRGNLAVALEPPSLLERERAMELVRSFLAAEYEHVLGVLRANQPFLSAIADRLMFDPVVDQDELAEICRAHGLAAAPADG